MSAPTTSPHLADARATFLPDALSRIGAAPALALLTVLCALLYLPGIAAIPPTDRDEARFMQATKQMIETGDFIDIRFQDEPRNKKPAGIHWLQAAAVKIAGQGLTTYWPYRLPSALAAWIAVLACYGLGARLFDRRTGLVAGAVLATSLMVVIEAHIAKTDATLLAATTIAMGCLALAYTGRDSMGPAMTIAFWIALAVGMLIKGPVSLAVVLVTVGALGIADKNIRWLKRTRPLIGVPLVLAISLPWFLAASSGGGGNNFVVEAVRADLLPKLIGGQESHGALPGAHLLAGLATVWPWSLLLPFAIAIGWRRRADPAIRFCLAWALGTWVLFEAVPTKLPHYTLPAFPALALFIAFAAQGDTLGETMRSLPGRIYRGLWAAVTAALAGGIVYAGIEYGGSLLFGMIAAILLGAGAPLALSNFRGPKPFAMVVAIAAAFTIVLSAGVVPRLSDLAVSKRLADTISLYRGTTDAPVAMAGYSEPSAVFLLGTATLLTDTAGVRDYLAAHPGAVGVIESDQVDTVAAAVAASDRQLQKLGIVEGYNYSRGDPVALSVVTVIIPEAQSR